MAANNGPSLEEQLSEAANKLLQPQSSVRELLALLDQVACWLSTMESASAESIEATLSPLLKALVADEQLWHADTDVNVAVAACICEILRITVPNPPFIDNEKLKAVLELIVHCFRDLSDTSGRSYNKRIRILETVADIRLGALMLNLECEVLIAEMFDIFLEMIRDYHPENIISSMETIMTETIHLFRDGEDISVEILSPLLDALKKDNQEFLPIAVNLAKNVIESCAAKLKPHLIEAIKHLDTTLDKYSDVITSICEEDPLPADDEHSLTSSDSETSEANSEQ